jgi:hypothetical protein
MVLASLPDIAGRRVSAFRRVSSVVARLAATTRPQFLRAVCGLD